MQHIYYDILAKCVSIHRIFSSIIITDLKRFGNQNINSTEALIVYILGKREMIISELSDLASFFSTNISYPLHKMIRHGYIEQNPSPYDQREQFIKLSDKGIELLNNLNKKIEERSALLIEEIPDIRTFFETLTRIEEFLKEI